MSSYGPLTIVICLTFFTSLTSYSVEDYSDGRPSAALRLEAVDQGIVLRHGHGPNQCDDLGARDVWVFEADGTYHMHYDAAGPNGWLTSLAVSKDLTHWEKRGPALDFGPPGSDDAKSASYGITYNDGAQWHMFYLGTPNVSRAPHYVPAFPYLTMKAKSHSPEGPWVKQRNVTPFRPTPGTYYSATASPGHVIKHGDEYLQFFSASTQNHLIHRTLGIARTKDLDGAWTIDPSPIVPLEEQIENSSLYFEEENETWFLFTNHVGIDHYEYTDAVWVYWSKDINHWDANNKAVVLDGRNCSWSKRIIGLPSVIKTGNRLAIFYDGLEGQTLPPAGDVSHMSRDIGLAWLNLPLKPPMDQRASAPLKSDGKVYSTGGVILFPVYGYDSEVRKEEVNFYAPIPADLPLHEKLDKLCWVLRMFKFNDLPVQLDGIEVRDGKKVARIHLRENATTQKSWKTGYFQGSTGGHFTTVTLRKTLLQPDYTGEWIDCVEFYYEGKPVADVWDHISLTGTFCRGEDETSVW